MDILLAINKEKRFCLDILIHLVPHYLHLQDKQNRSS